jgi:hypothetical protein
MVISLLGNYQSRPQIHVKVLSPLGGRYYYGPLRLPISSSPLYLLSSRSFHLVAAHHGHYRHVVLAIINIILHEVSLSLSCDRYL